MVASRSALVAILVLVGAFLVSGTGPASAGWLEDFFDPPQYRAVAPGLSVTVRARRQSSRSQRSAQADRRAARPRKVATAKTLRRIREVIAKVLPSARPASLDPSRNEKWYLNDPTLRRGDILVLSEGAVVYDGQPKTDTHGEDEFVPLKKAPHVPAARQRELGMMVSGIWRPDTTARAKPKVREADALVSR